MKKLFYALLLSLMPISAAMAQEEFVAEGLNLSIVNDSCVRVIPFNGYKYSGQIVIPETIRHNGKTYYVTELGKSAFASCNSLTSVVLPKTLKVIGTSAFSYSENITNIALPSNLETIGEWAFSNCTGISKIVIPNSVKEIGVNCFGQCTALKSVVLGRGLTTIKAHVFSHCSSLKTITIPSTIEEIKDRAFSNSGITTVTFQGKNTKYTDYAFSSTPWFSANSQRTKAIQKDPRYKISKQRTATF